MRRAGALRKLVMLHLLLVAVCAGAAASPRCAAEDGAAWSSLADSATVLEANVSAAEQQAQLKRQLGGALASAAPAVVRGLVVVIDLSHLTVAIDRCNRGSMRSGAWARHRDKQIVRQTHRLLTAAADAGAIKIEVRCRHAGCWSRRGSQPAHACL